jgi:uncharacterized protein
MFAKRSRLLVAAACLVPALAALAQDGAWRDDLAAWRARADAGLKRERGWLSITGRWELAPGTTTLGSDPASGIVLPAALSPPTLGTIEVRDGKAKLVLARGVTMRTVVNNQADAEFEERTLASGANTVEWVTAGRLSLQVVRRDDGRYVLRTADRDAPVRTSFPGRLWYEPKHEFRLPARFVAGAPGAKIPIVNVRGEVSDEAVAGKLEFTLDGRHVTLDALDDEGDLFVIFRDATSGETTYPPGRFISIKKPADGRWVIDFNRAYNPPCAFSQYTTCPLPPPQNSLPAAIPAGERYAER